MTTNLTTELELMIRQLQQTNRDLKALVKKLKSEQKQQQKEETK